jgi:hypothetical protein
MTVGSSNVPNMGDVKPMDLMTRGNWSAQIGVVPPDERTMVARHDSMMPRTQLNMPGFPALEPTRDC